MELAHEYREHLPALPLRPYVECYWEAFSRGASGFSPVELLVPDLRVEVLFSAGSTYRWAKDASSPAEQAPHFACIGMRSVALAVVQPGPLAHFAIRLRPAGLGVFSNVALGELTQRCVDARELFGRSAVDLSARLFEVSSGAARVGIADGFLIDRLAAGADDVRLASGCARALVESGGLLDIAEVADRHGIGYRRLDRLFQRRVGLSPKHFAKVARLQRALEIGTQHRSPPLVEVAARAGYADQPHMTRDFRALIGRSPAAFFRERLAVFETLRQSGSVGLKPLDDEPSPR